MTNDIPTRHTKEDIKAREKLIINETYEKASRSYESTLAVFRLTEILEGAVKTGEQPAKRNTRNQKQFEKLLIMKFDPLW